MSTTMEKFADLLKLDTKGVSPQALTSIVQGQANAAFQTPGMIALVSRRKERLRRIRDELQNPGMHLKPVKPPAGAGPDLGLQQGGGDEMGMGPPSGPTPPSNLLGMFEGGGMPSGAPGGGMPGGGGSMMGKLGHVKQAEEFRESAFKYGFFMKVAQLGLSPDEMETLVRTHETGKGQTLPFDKSASVPPLLTLGVGSALGRAVSSMTGGAAKYGGKTLGGLASLATMGPLWLAPLLGLPLGYGAYKLLAPGYEKGEDIQEDERVALYKRLAREAKQRSRKLQKKRLTQTGRNRGERDIKVPEIG